MNNRDTEQMVADRIIELLDQGELPPWEKPWKNSQMGDPRNAITMKPYRGINHWLTLISQSPSGYDDPRWLTYKQAQQLGGHVKRGEKGTTIVFWKKLPRKQAEDEEGIEELLPGRDSYWIARIYRVFNVEQTEDCKLDLLAEPPAELPDPIEQAEAIIQGMPNPPAFDTYQHLNTAPHYAPQPDIVRVPTRDRYDVPERWYNTVFHELAHSTGHPKRLNRFTLDANRNDVHNYGVEELVASMGAAMLSRKAGIERENLEQNASYVKHWRDAIAADKAIVLRAAGRAQKAVDLILDSNGSAAGSPAGC